MSVTAKYERGVAWLFENGLEVGKKLLIALPAAHFTFVIVYLYFYYEGFGRGLSIYAAPTDVWSVSLSDVAPAYVSFLIGIGLALLNPGPPTATQIGAARHSVASRAYWLAAIASVLMSFVAAGVFSLVFYVIARDYGIYLYQLLYLPIGIGIVLLEASVIGRVAGWRGRAVLITILSMIMISLSGLGDGENHRKLPYTALDSELPMCKEGKILRRIGDKLLAVNKAGQRRLLSNNCEVHATFQMLSRPLKYKPITPAKALERL